MRHCLSVPMTRRLLLEGLEKREVLSGNVTATIDTAGHLVVIGENLSNNIVISADATAGTITVAGGMNGAIAGTQTQVNGSLQAATFNNFNGDIVLNMRGGFDQVVITSLDIGGHLYASLGAGNDRLSIQSGASAVTNVKLNDGSAIVTGAVSFGGSVNIDAGDRHDVVATLDAQIRGDLHVTAGAGNDTFVQSGASLTSNFVGGNVTLNMDDGDDVVQTDALTVDGKLTINDSLGAHATVRLNGATVAGTTKVQTTEGSDVISVGTDGVVSGFISTRLIINAGSGADEIRIRNAAMYNLTVHAGSGDNLVTLANVAASDTLTITASNDNDTVNLTAVFTDVLFVRTWGGADTVKLQAVAALDAFFDLLDGSDELEVTGSIFSHLAVRLGDGDDKLVFGTLTVIGDAEFDGGDGADSQSNLGGNSIANLELLNF